MAIVESRVKDGVLSLGADPDDMDFSCQVTNARINTSYTDDGDLLETLCGDTIPPGRKLDSRSLAGTFVQDWTAATSITDFVWDHELEEMAFSYTPNVEGPTLTGTLRVEVPSETYGGDVNTRITSDFEWFIIGDVTRTPPVGTFESADRRPVEDPSGSQGPVDVGDQSGVDRTPLSARRNLVNA